MSIKDMTTVQRGLVPSEHELMVFQTMAKQAVGSKLYRGIGDEFAVMTIMLAARELDIPPMAALNGGINIINGKTEIAARMMGALIMRRGHTIRVESSTPEQCTLVGIRADNGEKHRETFTYEEAKNAGLIKDGGGWKKWPKDMCYARALSRLARRLFPDVIGMGYIEGEICETIKRPSVEVEHEICNVEITSTAEENLQKSSEENIKKELDLLVVFLSKFDKEESKEWQTYISQVQEKVDITITEIIDKYNEDPEKAKEKFNTWRSLYAKKS